MSTEPKEVETAGAWGTHRPTERTARAHARTARSARIDDLATIGAKLDQLLAKIDLGLAESEAITRRLSAQYGI
jgi:hypothetical protein